MIFNNNNNNNNLLFVPPPNILPVFPYFPHHPYHIIPPPINNNFTTVKDSRKKNINYFVVIEDKVILYINKDQIRQRTISEYNNRDLPNDFIFKKNTLISNGYHIDLDYILNILPINDAEVRFIGTKTNQNNYRKQVVLKILLFSLLFSC